MASITTVVARNDFSSVLNRAAFGKERVILKRRGKSIAALVPMEDLALLQSLEDKLDSSAVLASRKETRKKGTKSLAQLRADVGE